MKKMTSSSNARTFNLILTSMAIALVFVATLLLNIKLPITANGGLVHLGTGMLFIIAILFGPKTGMIAGAVGMAMFDLYAGWTAWAPISFFARGLQGYVVGRIAWSNGRNGGSKAFNLLATIVSIPLMLGGYYIGEAIMLSSWIIPAASIPGNIVQNVIGVLVAIPAIIALKKVPYFK